MNINYLLFESSLPDQGQRADAADVLQPAGKEHAELFASHLPSSVNIVRGPWNEENYAWEFLTKCEGIRIGVLTGKLDDDGWQIIVIPVSLFAFLRRRKIGLAVDTVTAGIEDFLRADPLFNNVRRYSESEYRDMERADLKA